MLEYRKSKIKKCYWFKPSMFEDNRGFFMETFTYDQYMPYIGNVRFLQDNLSVSKYGVLRGLHYQTGMYTQGKLITVLKGHIMDVVVDCRKTSDTFGEVDTFLMGKGEQLYIPRGCAHGFLSLSNDTTFTYKCDNIYHKESESGIIFNDPDLNIDWGLDEESLIISDKDRKLPNWKDAYKFQWS